MSPTHSHHQFKPIYPSLTPPHTLGSCLQTSNLVRFTFVGCFNSLNQNAERSWSKRTLRRREGAQENTPCAIQSALNARPFQSHLSATFRIHFSTGPWWSPTQRAGQPVVITPCKCNLDLLMRPLLYHLN